MFSQWGFLVQLKLQGMLDVTADSGRDDHLHVSGNYIRRTLDSTPTKAKIDRPKEPVASLPSACPSQRATANPPERRPPSGS